MLRAPHFAHASLSQAFDESIAPELASGCDFGAQGVHDPRADIRHHHDQQVGEHEPEEELQRIRVERRDAQIAMPNANHHRHRAD